MRRCQTPAPLRTPPLEHEAAALRGHTRSEAVSLGAPTIIWLECPLRHDSSNFLLQTKRLRLAANVICVKETGILKAIFAGQNSPRFEPRSRSTFRKLLKTRCLKTVHNFKNFSEIRKNRSPEKVKKRTRQIISRPLWNSLASGVCLC